jgi:uncharacterized membrane protein
MESHLENESIKQKRQRWKLNILIALNVFTVIGLFLILGSSNQLYRKINNLENLCYVNHINSVTKSDKN